MTRVRLVWPDLTLRCCCCHCVAPAVVVVNNSRKRIQTRRCSRCESLYLAGPLVELGVDGDGVPFIRPLGLFIRPV